MNDGIANFEGVIAAELAKDFVRAGAENETVTTYADCTGLYGDGGQWLEVFLHAGTFTITNAEMGGDPKSGTPKALYVPGFALVAPSKPVPAPAPAPDTPTTSPVPAGPVGIDPPAPTPATPAPAPSAPTPATPAPTTTVAVDLTKYEQVATESQIAGAPATWTPDASGTVFWGTASAATPLLVLKGVPVTLDYAVLGDPAPSQRKSIFRPIAATSTPAAPPASPPAAPAPTPAAPAPGPTNQPLGDLPALFYRPGSPRSPFKCRVVNPVLDSRSLATTVGGNKGVVSDGSYAVNVFFGKATDPARTITGGEGDIVVEHMPDGVTTPGLTNTDGKVTIVEGPDALVGYDFWLFNDKTSSDGSRVRFAMDGLLFGTSASDPRAGTCGAGCPSIAGVIRQHELASLDDGEETFGHALRVGLPRSTLANGFVLPARMQDNSASQNYGFVPQGSLLVLAGLIAIDPTWSNLLKKLVRTLQVYGAYPVDITDANSTPFVFYVENDVTTGKAFNFWDVSWTSAAHTPSQTSDMVLRLIESSLRVVTAADAFIDDNGVRFWPDWTSIAQTPAKAPATVTRAQMQRAANLPIGMKPDTSIADMKVWPENSQGNIIAYEATTGADDSIGLVTGDSVRAIATMSPLAMASVISTAICYGNRPFQITDKTTGDMPAKPWLNVRQSFQGDSSNLIGDQRGNPLNLTPDGQHQRHPLFVPMVYLALRGGAEAEALFLRLLAIAKQMCAWNYFTVPSQSRGPQGGKTLAADAADLWMDGIFNPDASANGQRGEAWKVDTLAETYLAMTLGKAAGFALPADGWYEWLGGTAVPSNVVYLYGKFVTGTLNDGWADPYYVAMGAGVNDIGCTVSSSDAYGRGPLNNLLITPWFQQGFQATVIGWMATANLDLKSEHQSKLQQLALWMGKWPVMIHGDPFDITAYPWQRAGEYAAPVARRNVDGSLAYAKNGAELYALGYAEARPTGNGFLDHDSDKVSDGLAYGFEANAFEALVFAKIVGVPGADAGITRATGSDQWKASPDLGAPFNYMTPGYYLDGSPQVGDGPAITGDTVLPLSGLGASAPAPSAPVPAAPSPSAPPAAIGIDQGVDGGSFSVTDTAAVYAYGANGTFEYFTLPAGSYSILPKSMGVPDPVVGVVKHLYLTPAGTKTTIQSTIGSAAAPAAPAPSAPSPAAPAPAAPSGKWISNEPMTIPARGFFRSLPLLADMKLPDCYVSLIPDAMHVNMYNWSDGCVVETDTPDCFILAIAGAGHESAYTQPNVQGYVCLRIQLGKPAVLFWSNAPLVAASTSQSEGVTGDGQKLMANGMAYNGHGYRTLQAVPRAWGLGRNLVFRWNTGVVGPLIHDISQATLGESVLFDVMPPYGPPGSGKENQNHGYYMTTCRDDIRQGFWACEPQGGGPLMFLKPFRDASGKLRATITYWPGIIGNTGQNMFHVTSLDLLVAVGGSSFRGNWAQAHGFETLTIMKPGTTAADAQIFTVPYKTADGSLPPTVAPDGWYGNPRQVDSFTIATSGSGYHVGQVLDFDPNTPIPEMDGNHTPGMSTLQSYGSPLDVVVSSVDVNGGITGLRFGETSYDGINMPDNGYFWAGHGAIAEGAVIRFPLVDRAGDQGSGASIDALIGDSLSTIAVEKVGYQWVESRKAAYGSIVSEIVGKTVPVKLAMPANPTTDPWIISSPQVAHDPADTHGDADLVAAENGDYGKQGYLPAPFDCWVRHASAFHNPQIMSMD